MYDFPVFPGDSIGRKAVNSTFLIFRKKERAVEHLIVIFENSSPKGTFR